MSWVELAPLTDQDLVPGTVAQALGVREEPGRALIETLRDRLRASNSCWYWTTASICDRRLGHLPQSF